MSRRGYAPLFAVLFSLMVTGRAEAAARHTVIWEDFWAVGQSCGYVCQPYWTTCFECSTNYCPGEYPCQQCSYVYSCSNFRYTLPDGDLIDVTFYNNAVPTDIIEFEFQAGTNVTWWKQLRIHDGYGSYWNLYTQDSRKNGGRESLWAGQAFTGYLTFWKAKEFGIHTEMYRLNDLSRYMKPGTRAVFRWVQD